MTDEGGHNAETALTQIWFMDTASLLSMAVDEDIRTTVLDEIGTDPVIVVDIVRDELTHLSTRLETRGLAIEALRHLPASWIDLESSKYVSAEDVVSVQDEVSDGRPLLAAGEHLAESTIIALARQSAQSTSSYQSVKVLLSEDWNARRVAAAVPHMTAVSIRGILLDRVLGNPMSPVSPLNSP